MLCCSQVRVKALEALGAARVLDKGLAACRALEAGKFMCKHYLYLCTDM